MEDLDYKKKLEDLKNKNISKIENFKSIYNQIQSNIDLINIDILKIETEIEIIKKIESDIKHHFFELCVSLKI
jgi:hypothetical protein